MIRHALAPVLPSAASGLGIPRRLGQPGITLTFDDGPHPDGTPAVLELLARAHARAMFFLIGEQVQRRPGLVREIIDGGHRVGVHAHRHRLQLRMSAASVEADLHRARVTIEDAAGAAAAWHRPPYGIYSPAGLSLVRDAEMKPLLWSRWGKDWRRFTTPERIAHRVTRGIGTGDVVLLHDADFYSSRDSHRRTVKALELILAFLGQREIGTVLPP